MKSTPDTSWANVLDATFVSLAGTLYSLLLKGLTRMPENVYYFVRDLAKIVEEPFSNDIPGSFAQMVRVQARLPRGHHVPVRERVEAVTLTAESLRIINNPKFREWAEENKVTREKHSGQIKSGGEIDQTLSWLHEYMRGTHGRVCPLDVKQMQRVMDLSGLTVSGFVADGTWGDLSIASIELARSEGHRLWREAKTSPPDHHPV